VEKLASFYSLTLENKNNLMKFDYFLHLNENKLNEEEFLKNYNEVCSHEINLILYFKFPELFNKYVKNILKYKFEKTFIDYFLLDDYETLLQYLTPLKIQNLRTDELCLLLLKLVNKNPEEAKKIRDIIQSRVKKPEDVENILLTNFNIMMNMRVEEDKDLEGVKTFEEKLERPIMPQECDEECLGFASNNRGPNIGRRDFNNMLRKEPNFCPESNFINTSAFRGPNFYRSRMNLAACLSNIAMPLQQADFLAQERAKPFEDAFKKAQNDMGAEFEKPGVAKEYKETHYYLKEHKNQNVENPLWLDFAEHIILNKKYDNFLSKYVLYNNIDCNEIILILSIIGLPVHSFKH
jgi:hypothetical protein